MKPTVLMRPGSSARSKARAAASQLVDDDAVVSGDLDSNRRRISTVHRQFVLLYADTGFRDPDQAAKAAGFSSPGIGWKLVDRLRDLIERERASRSMATVMEADEALQELAKVARQDMDLKTKHSALRTVLEIQGMLRDRVPIDDKKKMVREIEVIAAILREAKGRKALGSAPVADSNPVIDLSVAPGASFSSKSEENPPNTK